MESSPSAGGESTLIAARTSMVDSFRGCGLSGFRIDKEDLKRRISLPEHLRLAMRDAIQSKDPNAGERHARSDYVAAPEAPMVVFVNSRSGGRHGPVLKGRLQELMGQEQVFDLSLVKPPEFVRYGLACLENLASLGDQCAKETREKLRVMVAGGDGTVGWVLGSLGELYNQRREPVPPTGIIPLGTGNDLARSFGWGGSFPFAWKSSVKRSLYRAISGPICRLDSWHVLVSMPGGEKMELPHSLKHTEECNLDQDLEVEGELPEKEWMLKLLMGSTIYVMKSHTLHTVLLRIREILTFSNTITCKLCQRKVCLNHRFPADHACSKLVPSETANGLSTNKFLLAFAARNSNSCARDSTAVSPSSTSRPTSPPSAKLIYSGYGCTQGWFCTPCISDPSVRGLKNILRMHIKRANCSEWEQIRVPSSVRSIVALNLHNYGSGRNPWGNLKPEYMEKRGFVEAHADDGLLEIFGLKQGWHASFVMVELISAKHIAQAAAIRLEIRGGEWKQAFMQMDGEPWKQPMNKEYSTFVEIKRVPFQSLMINGD